MPKRPGRTVKGGEIHGLRPDWRPLLDFAPEEVPDFMWMYRVELEGGATVEAYKHTWTRQYLHLDQCGRAYEFRGDSWWQEVDRQGLLAAALRGYESRASIVRQNEWVDGERITWARSATRHRISRAQTLFVIQNAGVCFPGASGRRGELGVYFFGDDEDEAPLEVAGFENEGGVLHIVHSMPLWGRFEEQYMEGLRWRR